MSLAINSAADFEREVLGATGQVFAFFTAKWCPYCRIQAPRIEELASKLNFTLDMVDVDAAAGVDDRYDVQTIPSLLVFKEGKLCAREMVAYMQPHELEQWVQAQL